MTAQLILLDLGGVLVELGDELFPSDWFIDRQSFGLTEWFDSATATKFERGEISASTFLGELTSRTHPNITEKLLENTFKGWVKGLYPGASELVNQLKSRYQVAVLSNTNELHEERLTIDFGLSSLIEHLYFSHKIGLAKPNKASFAYVLEKLGFRPQDTIFFDDNVNNVMAARELGIQSHHVFSPADVAAKLGFHIG